MNLVLTVVTFCWVGGSVFALPSSKPWKAQPQPIPGKVECKFYDEGSEGIAYHNTVDVKETETYDVSLMYTSNRGGSIAIDVDGQPAVKGAMITSIHADRDPVPWRQWHHWNRVDHLAKLPFSKGTHVLKLRVLTNGNMNFDYLEFRKEWTMPAVTEPDTTSLTQGSSTIVFCATTS